MSKACKHLGQIQDVQAGTPAGCAECLVLGDEWESLRLCLICGHTGCCDSSKNKHATKHFKQTKPNTPSFAATKPNTASVGAMLTT